MRLSELRELVEMAEEQLDGTDRDPKVMVAHQPFHPLAAPVRNVRLDSDRADDPDADLPDDDREDVVWLVAGESSAYAPRDLWNEV